MVIEGVDKTEGQFFGQELQRADVCSSAYYSRDVGKGSLCLTRIATYWMFIRILIDRRCRSCITFRTCCTTCSDARTEVTDAENVTPDRVDRTNLEDCLLVNTATVVTPSTASLTRNSSQRTGGDCGMKRSSLTKTLIWEVRTVNST
jgi:hypothetical protein